MSETVAVLGAGSFGTALAKVLAEGGHAVRLFARDEAVARAINEDHKHPRRLPGVRLPAGLRATTELADALRGAQLVVSVVPTAAVRAIWGAARALLEPGAYVMSATKGIEVETLKLVSDILEESLAPERRARLCYLSGPSFAVELARRLPTAVTIAAAEEPVAAHVQALISNDYFRAYTTTDVVGVELAGAIKNVIAVAAGVADGLGLGHNTQAALITRGLAEMTRLATKLGARPLTLSGLAGVGDLVLTCTGGLSRNRTVGRMLGEGKPLDRILEELGQVAEGVPTARAVHALAAREGVEVPIASSVYRLLFEAADPRFELAGLMGRRLKRED